MHVKVMVPATTSNLGPGFDCLGLALTLYNTVSLCRVDAGLSIDVEGEGIHLIPRDETNQVVQAIHLLFAQAGLPVPGLHIHLKNDIPVCSGLGSSGAAVLGGLLAANQLLPEPLSRETVLALATELEGHPDNVAPALYGGLVLANRDGDRLLVESLPVAPLQAVVALPDVDLPTAEARAVLPLKVSLFDAAFNAGRTALLVQALITGDYGKLGVAMQDRLHQRYRVPLVPGMHDAFQAARAAGASGVALSGAGPGVLAFAPDGHQRIADAMCRAFVAAGVECRSWVLSVDRVGSVVG